VTRAFAIGLVLLGVGTASVAAAAETAPGAPALKLARAAWERGALDTAEPLYREAIERGGLAPNELLEGYVRLGAIRASLGKKDQAIAAFRAASILDASFAVPAEAGPKGPALADRAKRDTAKIGSLKLTLKAPKETPAGRSFRVTAHIDAAHIPIVTKVGLVAKDGTSGKESTAEARPDESIELEIPSDVTLPNASIVVRIDALDRNNNRLGSVEERVKVPDSGAVAAHERTEPKATRAETGAPRPSEDGLRKGGSFWSSPWPYVIGGVALAGAGAAVYFGTRPSEDVSVGQIGVRTR
jgi:tetratricopeptide (TPR) repeat protein